MLRERKKGKADIIFFLINFFISLHQSPKMMPLLLCSIQELFFIFYWFVIDYVVISFYFQS